MGLSLTGHQVIQVSKCDHLAMLVEIITNEQKKCIGNVRIIPI